jgi:hypothetical protein
VAVVWSVEGFDPMHTAEVAWTVSSDPGVALTVTLSHDGQVVWEETGSTDSSGELTGVWDGRSGADWAGAGVFTLDAVVDGSGEAAVDTLGLVRVGMVDVYADDDGGLTSERVPLYYMGDSALQDPAYPLAELDRIEEGDSLPLDFPPIDEEPAYGLTITDTMPTAWSFDSQPLLTFIPATGEHTRLGDTGLDAVEVTLAVDGWTVMGSDRVSAGRAITLMRDAPLGDTLGVTDELLTLRFSVGEDEVAQQAFPLRAYRLLGPATFGSEDRRYNPWMAAIDPALRALEGTPAEHDRVADAVVDWVYHDLGLAYDIEPHFYFSDFLLRANGSIVNCTDSGNITTTYSNMLGAELHHLIILENFDLNEIKAIGIEDYTSCPFGPFGCGFSYHAVTTDDGGETIWDATLALDGDGDPGSGPYDELLVQTIDGEEYLSRLVRDGSADYYYESQGTIQ